MLIEGATLLEILLRALTGILVVSLFVILVFGRTTRLVAEPVTPAKLKKGAKPAPGGLIYFLPYTQFQAEVDRELEVCELEPNRAMVQAWLSQENANIERLMQAFNRIAGQKLPIDDFAQSIEASFPLEAAAHPLLATLLQRYAQETRTDEGVKRELPKDQLTALYHDLVLGIFADAAGVGRPSWPSEFGEVIEAVRQRGRADENLLRELTRALGTPIEQRASFRIVIAHRTQITQRILKDHAHAYTIDYKALGAQLKSTDLSVVKYPNGVLKSLNATVDDRSADVVSGILTGALSLAAASGGFPLPAAAAVVALAQGVAEQPRPETTTAVPAPSDPPRPPQSFGEFLAEQAERVDLLRPSVRRDLTRCQEIKSLLGPTLRQAEALATKLRQTDTELDQQAAELSAAKAKLAELNAVEDVETPEGAIEAATAEVAAVQAEIAALNTAKTNTARAKADLETQHSASLAALKAARRKITVTISQVFDPAAEEPQLTTRGAAEAAEAWFDPQRLEQYCRAPGRECMGDVDDGDVDDGDAGNAPAEAMPRWPKILDHYIAFHLPPGAAGIAATKGQASTSYEGGKFGCLTYREPAAGLLISSSKEPCLTKEEDAWKLTVSRENIIHEEAVDIPQLGVLATLPLTNAAFAHHVLSAKFSPLGSLTELTYTTKSRAERTAKAFEGSAASIGEFANARRKSLKAKLGERKDALEAQKNVLDLELELEKSRDALEAYRRGDTPPKRPVTEADPKQGATSDNG